MPPMSQFLALPCEADSCTPERLSIRRSVVDASFDLMLPAAAAITAPPGTSPPSAGVARFPAPRRTGGDGAAPAELRAGGAGGQTRKGDEARNIERTLQHGSAPF